MPLLPFIIPDPSQPIPIVNNIFPLKLPLSMYAHVSQSPLRRLLAPNTRKVTPPLDIISICLLVPIPRIPLHPRNSIVTQHLFQTRLAICIRVLESPAPRSNFRQLWHRVLVHLEDGTGLDGTRVVVRWNVDAYVVSGNQAIAAHIDASVSRCKFRIAWI
jgi:hypothetical protein